MRETGLDAEIVGKETKVGNLRRLKNPVGIFFYPVLDHHHLSFLFHCKVKSKRIRQSKEHAHEGIVKWVNSRALLSKLRGKASDNPKEVEISPYVRIVLKKMK